MQTFYARLAVAMVLLACATALVAQPALQLPGPITAEATGPGGAVVTYSTSGGTGPDDENGRPQGTITCAPASGSLFPLGVTTVQCTSSNGGSGSFTVTVDDTTAPQLQVPDSFTVQANDSAGTNVTFNASAQDAVDGSVSVACNPQSGSFFAVGTTQVTCTAADSRGNQASSSFNVTVTAAPPPPPPPPPPVPGDVTAEATGPGGAVVTYSTSGGSGPDDENGRPTTTLACAPASGSLFALGETTVNCSSNGNHAGSFKVRVVDTTAPALELPRSFTAKTNDANGTVVTFNASASDLVDGSVAPSCTPSSGSFFSTGTTQVTCTAADARGNQSNGSFEITVVQSQPDDPPDPPTLPEDITAEATGPDGAVVTYSTSGGSGPDDENGRPRTTLTCAPASGSLFPLGTTVVSCSSNGSPVGTFDVHIVDTTPPALTLPDDITTPATSVSGAVVTYDASASDLVDGAVTVNCSPASGATFAVGTTAVTCSAVDSRGNAANGSFNVTVTEGAQPLAIVVSANPATIWPPNKQFVNVTVSVTATNGASITAQIVAVTSNEVDDGKTSPDWVITGPLTVDLRAEKNDQAGQREYTITVEATDSNGNHASGSVKVIVTNDESTSSVSRPRDITTHDPLPKRPGLYPGRPGKTSTGRELHHDQR